MPGCTFKFFHVHNEDDNNDDIIMTMIMCMRIPTLSVSLLFMNMFEFIATAIYKATKK